MNESEKYTRLRDAIAEAKSLIASGDPNAETVGLKLCDIFEEDIDIKGLDDYTSEKAYLQALTLETILELHIMRGDPIDISLRFGQLLKKIKDDIDHFPDWTEEDKSLIIRVGFEARDKVHAFFSRKYREKAERFRKSRTPQCKCLLCRKSLANKTGSHMVPHLLIAELFSYDGSRDREKVVVAAARLSEGETERYFGNKVYDDTVNELIGRSFSEEEVEKEIEKHNPLTLDYVFCKECEDRFGVIETLYSEIISGKVKKYSPEIPYLFWLSVIWRMSVGEMGLPMERDHLEKVRKVLDKCLALKKEDIATGKSQLGHCAYILQKAKDTKDETLGIIGPHVCSMPYRAMIGNIILDFFPTISDAKKYCRRSGISEEYINSGNAPEKILEIDFIDFWMCKRQLLDKVWENDRSLWNLGRKSDKTLWKFERDNLLKDMAGVDSKEDDDIISPWLNTENSMVIKIPRAIKKNLADMMYDTTVTIIIISPKIKESNWMEWEIKYCLREKTRKGRTSKRNGLVGVIMKVDDSYDWFKTIVENSDGCKTCTYDNTILHDIIRNNRFNQVPKVYSCNICKSVDKLTGSYISLIEEDDFFNDPEKYINNAYDKSENDALGYNIIQD